MAATWEELLSAALLGTDRRSPPASPPGPLAPFGRGDDSAIALLDRAAAVTAARRAGAQPVPDWRPLTAAPRDGRKPCLGAAARRVEAMLAGRHGDLLPELLATLVAHELALPPEHLVALMDLTVSEPEVRALVVRVAGPILPWLAGVLPQLGWPLGGAAGAGDPVDAWQHGKPAERIEALRQLRVEDPAAARRRVEADLAGERAELRAACYGVLAVGLSADDEPLLERALDDRSAGVRQVAAALLDRLPTSRRAARMAARARELVRVVSDRGGRDRLDVVLLAPVPAGWERDGVSPTAPRGVSLGVHALERVVVATPLAAWDGLAAPDELIVLAAEHELGSVLLGAWAGAAAAQRDAAWARLLIDETEVPALVTALDLDDLVAVAIRRAGPDTLLTPVTLAALEALPRPWPESVGQVVVSGLLALFVDRRAGRHTAPLLRRLACSLDPAALAPAAAALAELGLSPPVDGVRDDLVDLLGFRAAMLDELRAEEGP